MRLIAICLSLCLLAPSVLGNVLAGPYQSVLYWYAYRIDIMTHDAANREIAVGCVGTGPGKTCLFDEFLRYIQKTGRNTKLWTGSTNVGKDLTPDVISTAEQLATGGEAKTPSRYPNTSDPSKMFKKFKGKVGITYSELMRAVVDTIQKSRASLETLKGVDIETELKSARQALTLTHRARVADNAKYIIQGVNAYLKEQRQTWTVKTKTIPASEETPFEWEEVDTAKTIAAHKGATSDIMKAVQKYIGSWGTGTTKTDATRHMAPVYACQEGESRLNGGPKC
ncbi:hypothetical protein BO78DRAFT_451622 [Aspergillus sclerotiicarbonarius CBS 121057]|uniref:Uncharacterized protein n=1 Tax=Aspergillus sclerotiicarbonarius (strain CBS 121057 / IBT 28362) TaxID=1448318 RepID=A0A319ERS9_ASPSB|nr:hypothetical protein BO78DRAFT_451622 [Aspergillus sclerotiicarbonarius CBS 121057]